MRNNHNPNLRIFKPESIGFFTMRAKRRLLSPRRAGKAGLARRIGGMRRLKAFDLRISIDLTARPI